MIEQPRQVGKDATALTLIVPFCAALALSGAAHADVVAVKNRPALVNTQVLRLTDGKVTCKNEGGEDLAFPIEQVEYIQITGWQMFNLAEQQRRANDWHRSAVSYEKALAELQLDASAGKPPGDGLDRVLLVKCRLVQACDAQDRFERALELYLEVVERMPATAKTLRPRHLPETGAAWIEQASRRVDEVIARHEQDDLGRSLREWKQSWPRPTGSAPAMPADGLPGSDVDPRMRESIGQVSGMVKAGQGMEALSRISILQGQARGGARAELFYWQGRALEAMAPQVVTSRPANSGTPPRSGTLPRSGGTGLTEPGSDLNANDRQDAGPTDKNHRQDAGATLARAGLAYMRVVVHFPGHPLAAECLYHAGKLCRLTGREQQAKALWTELMNTYPKAHGPDGTIWADKAREDLK